MPVWINGAVMETAVVDTTDRGFTLGDGLFETMRLEAGTVRHFDRHCERLQAGAKILRIPIPASKPKLLEAIHSLVEAADLLEGVIRLTLTRGKGARGLLPSSPIEPTLVIAIAAKPPALGPARLTVSTITRRNEFSPLSAIKSLNYLDAILARTEAHERGFDEVILLNTQGRVAEASVSSVFAVIDGVLCTPPQSEGALPGVARGLILEQLKATEHPISRDDLAKASEIILTNVLGARAVSALDQQAKESGAWFLKIQQVIEGC